MRTEPVPRDPSAAAAAVSHDRSTAWLLDVLADAVAGMQTSLCWFSAHALGDRVFTVAANDASAAALLTRCLLPANLQPAVAPHLRVFVCAGSAAPFVRPPAWNLPRTDLRHLENLHLDPAGRVSASYDPARRCWMILDLSTRRALLWIADAGDLPVWETVAPFRQFLQWSLAGTALSVVHGGAVVHARHAVLLVGPSGSGKSTTVAACLQAGLGACGDDLVVVDRSARDWRVHALHDSIKLLPNPAVAIPSRLRDAPWGACGDKRFVRYSDAAPGLLVRTAPLRALLHCRVAKNPASRLVPVAPAEMLKAIGPPTVFFLRGREAHILGEVSALVRTLPGLRLELGGDPAEAAALLKNWLENCPYGERDA
ncbi:MAG: hypothetical protein K0Q91_552 [Fibrobacteria bacterium]|jgi:hypothetical protein|nr:hypothetical protein [Fibrobacteria bacterium]